MPEITLRGATYRVYQQKKSWLDAHAYCQKFGLTLPTLYNAVHFAALNAEVRKLIPNQVYWIGYNDIQTEGKFVWADNATGTLQLAAGSWNPFCQGQPDNVANADAVAVGITGYNLDCWDDDVSDHPFICTKPGVPPCAT
jgi:hypothetical protein